MSNPRILCRTCGRQRDCLLHQRADFPPQAAKGYLQRTCQRDGNGCDFQYRIGMEVALNLTPQNNQRSPHGS